jgi:hypothetical protein
MALGKQHNAEESVSDMVAGLTPDKVGQVPHGGREALRPQAGKCPLVAKPRQLRSFPLGPADVSHRTPVLAGRDRCFDPRR